MNIQKDNKVGKYFWFEYHCYESDDSCDEEIWYRSHQKVKVLSVSEWSFDNLQDRIDDGQPRVYKVMFNDGLKYDVYEDELMNSTEDFYRLNPPIKNLQESIRRILKEELHSPAGDKYKPNKYVVHKSAPHWRENIELMGLQTSVGDCYQIYVGGDVKCKKAIFATDSLNDKDMFDSTYDDDIWIIDTECAGVSWFKDTHYFKQGDNNYHIVTFKNISPDCLELIHKGTGKSY
jgi:hypothetical protein